MTKIASSRDKTILFTPAKTLCLPLFLVCTTLFISACSPLLTNGGSPVYVPSEQQAPQQTPTKKAPPAKIIAPAKTKVNPAQKAVTSLLQEAWQQHRAGNHQLSISITERAQRLDARRAEIYLLLARNYFTMGQHKLAQQLSQRGLSFSQNDKVIRQRLKNLLSEIQTSLLRPRY